MKKKLFYSFLMLSLVFSENKLSLLKNFSLIGNNLAFIKKFYTLSKHTDKFSKEYYKAGNQNIKKILFCSGVLICLNNHSITSLKDIFKKETIKKYFRLSLIRFTGCSVIHFSEGLWAFIVLQDSNKLPFYRNPRGTSLVLHEFNIDEEDKDQKNDRKNISKSEIKSFNSNHKLNSNDYQSSSEIKSDTQLSTTEVLKWQKESLNNQYQIREKVLIETSEKKLNVQTTKLSEELKLLQGLYEGKEKELIEQIVTSKEKLNVETSRSLDALKLKINEIEELKQLIEINNNQIINLKQEIESVEATKNQAVDLKNEYKKEIIALENQLKNIKENLTQAQTQTQLAKQHAQEKEKELIKQILTSKEKLNVETSRYLEELQLKIGQIAELTKLIQVNNNDIINLKKEIEIVEATKNQAVDSIKNEYEKKILTLKSAQEENIKILQKTKSSLEQEKNILREEYNKKIQSLTEEIILLKEKEKLNDTKQNSLLKLIEEKEQHLLIFECKMNKESQSMSNLKKQFRELNAFWEEAKEKKNKEAKTASLSKLDLISCNRLERTKEQIQMPHL